MSFDGEASCKPLLVSAALSLVLFTATVPLPRVDGHLIGSDGIRYYAILRSVALDGDWDFTNDYRLLGVRRQGFTSTGRPANRFAVGAAILWAPFFAAAHLVSLALRAAGFDVPVDGVSYVYEYAVCAATILYASLGFLLAFRVAIRMAAASSALVAVLAAWWATQATYYILAEPSTSHALTVFSTSLFLYFWYPPTPRRRLAGWIRLGLVSALAGLVRWQDGLIVLVPLTELAYWYARRQLGLRQFFARALAFGASALIGILPQIVMWTNLYGSPLLIPQGEGFLDWTSPHILATLFSTRHGLVSWHPVFLIALLGLPALWRRSRSLAAATVFLFAAQLYVNSCAVHWWADDAFGGRRFTSLVPLLIPPLACLMDDVRKGARRRALVALLLAMVVWNGLSFIQYRAGFVSKSDALTAREMTIDRLLLPLDLVRKIVK